MCCFQEVMSENTQVRQTSFKFPGVCDCHHAWHLKHETRCWLLHEKLDVWPKPFHQPQERHLSECARPFPQRHTICLSMHTISHNLTETVKLKHPKDKVGQNQIGQPHTPIVCESLWIPLLGRVHE